jgi:ABC-type sugar transport system ATPase subunit
VTHQIHLLKDDAKVLFLNNGQIESFDTLQNIIRSGVNIKFADRVQSQDINEDTIDENIAGDHVECEIQVEKQKLLYKREISRISRQSSKKMKTAFSSQNSQNEALDITSSQLLEVTTSQLFVNVSLTHS